MFNVLGLVIIIISIHWKLSIATFMFLVVLCAYSLYIAFSLIFKPQAKEHNEGYQNILNEDDAMDVEEIMILSERENETAKQKVLQIRRAFSIAIFTFAYVCIMLTYASLGIDPMRARYDDYEKKWNALVLLTFIFGTNATHNKGGYSFFYQSVGFLLIFIAAIFERKAQLWIADKKYMKVAKLLNLEEDNKESDHGQFENLEEYSKISEEDSKDESKGSMKSDKYSLNFNESLEESEESYRKSFEGEGVKSRHLFDKVLGDIKKSKSESLHQRDSHKSMNIVDDPYFKKKVYKMLKIKYEYGFMKALAGALFTVIILLLMISIIFNCNALSVILFVSLLFAFYRPYSYSSLVYINIFVVACFILQYGLALSNLSERNSPMIFPEPYTDEAELGKLNIPWYKQIYFFTKDNNAWAYYCSLMISYTRVKNLWFEGCILLLSNIYFSTFYSTIYNQNIEISNEKNITDIIKIQGDTITKAYIEKLMNKKINTIKEEEEFMISGSEVQSPSIKHTPLTDNQIEGIINRFYASSTITKLYNTCLNAV